MNVSLVAFTEPICDPGCGENAHCEYGIMNRCICNSGTTGNPYDACRVEEKKSCATTQCGRGALCKEIFKTIECVCPSGFDGNPYVICEDIDECINDACGESAVCINTPGSYDCRCKEGYAGNPFVMCSKIQGGICQDIYTCKCNSKVLCPNGYSCEGGRCKNLCEEIKCGPTAGCDAGKCLCPPGYEGNPNDLINGCKLKGQCNANTDCRDSEICFQLGKGLRKCVDACSKVQCGPNALCVGENHISHCICASGYLGNADDLSVGCQVEERIHKECNNDKDCKEGKVCSIDENGINRCLNPCKNVACGLHELCQLDINHNPTCTCKDEFLWNPVTSSCEKPSIPDCHTDNECLDSAVCHPDALGVLKCMPICAQFTCPLNSVCIAVSHEGTCQCLVGYTGNPNDRSGCKPIVTNQCTSDVQCSEQDTCHQDEIGFFTCKSACQFIKCGPNALCIVNNHVPQCQCPPGTYAGNPNDLDKGCEAVPCVYNIDCPEHQLCNRLTHTCLNVCDEDSCGINAVCIAEGHKAGCQCPQGFKPNPVAEIDCKTVDTCKPSPCHSSAKCEPRAGGYTCNCPLNYIGDPFTSGCRPEGDCPNGNRDCPLQSVCNKGRCVNPCQKTVCGPNAVCNVVNRNPVCICPMGFTPSANIAKDGCLRISRICRTDLDCGDEVCYNDQCKPACRSNADCIVGENCLRSMCLMPCVSHKQCRENEVCINGSCTLGCKHHEDCPQHESCVNTKCKNACNVEGVCGSNALCSTIDHKPVCSCSEGFEGNPTAEEGCIRVPKQCTKTDECPPTHMCVANTCSVPCSDTTACAIGERCYDNVCEKVCYSDSNCLPGEICSKGICQPGCLADSDCKKFQVCKKKQCHCNSGFIPSAYVCLDIDECKENPCHVSAKCINVPGSYKCICAEGTSGDPYLAPGCRKPNQCGRNTDCATNLACRNGSCYNPCPEIKCGINAECNIFNHRVVCSCPYGYLGDPTDINLGCFKVECLSDNDCAFDRYCDTELNKCAGNVLHHFIVNLMY